MKVIPREAGRVTYSTKIRELKKLPFTEKQKAIIIGMILAAIISTLNLSLTKKTNYLRKVCSEYMT